MQTDKQMLAKRANASRLGTAADAALVDADTRNAMGDATVHKRMQMALQQPHSSMLHSRSNMAAAAWRHIRGCVFMPTHRFDAWQSQHSDALDANGTNLQRNMGVRFDHSQGSLRGKVCCATQCYSCMHATRTCVQRTTRAHDAERSHAVIGGGCRAVGTHRVGPDGVRRMACTPRLATL